MTELAPLPVVLPLVVAALIAAVQYWDWRRTFDLAAMATALAVTGLSVALLLDARQGAVVNWLGGWMPRDGLAVGIPFVVDEIGAALAALAGFLMFVAFLFSWRYFDTARGLYHTLMLIFLAGLTGFCLTGDLFNLFVFFELMSVAAFALTAYKIEEKSPLQGALTFAVTNSIGASMILMGIALLFGRTGALNMAQIGVSLARQPADGLVVVAFVLLTAGLSIKAAVVPFHFWLPDAHAVAPTPVCVLFSGIMVELGIYGATRVYWTMFDGALGHHAAALRSILLGAGVLTMLFGGLLCFGQRHLKRLLAYSSISHVGMILAAVGLTDPRALGGAVIYILGHGTVKAALFVCAGILLQRNESLDELELHGRGRRLKGTAALFFIGGLALAGLPPFGTFLGKSLIEESAHHHGHGWLTPLLSLASILTGAAVLRAGGRIFLGWGATREELMEAESQSESPDRETDEEGGHVPIVMVAPAVVALAASLMVGLIPGIASWSETAGARFVDRPTYAAHVLHGEPVGVAPPHAPKGSPAKSLLIALAGVVAAVALALLTLFRLHLPAWWNRYVWPVVVKTLAPLKSLHTGHIGDYATWLVLGLVLYGALCAGLLRG